jgi:peptidoglycan/LPS O-acetylase OafA/YrhL
MSLAPAHERVEKADDKFSRQAVALRQRMPALDGLRAFAILSVLWHNSAAGQYHGNAIANLIDLFANSGWLGVQLFFVLSGFLITGILLDSSNSPKRFSNFYGRRILRIFPPYYALLIAICWLLPFLFPTTPALHKNLNNSIWYWLFLNNWTSHFIAGIPALPHLWSLAVEEQFYILWPACVFLLPQRALPWLCAGAVIVALLTRFGLTLYAPALADDAAYQFTTARWDALVLGAALAFFIRNEFVYAKLRGYLLGSFYCSAAYIVIFTVINRNFAPTGPGITPLNQTIAAIFFTAIIFFAIEVRTQRIHRWQNLLLNPALQSIGKYSYAMYLFHMPLIILLAPLWEHDVGAFSKACPSLAITCFSLIILVGAYYLAALSWVALERPCLKLKRFFV